jgi:indolepyruvate ferredoxin oxidoreductase
MLSTLKGLRGTRFDPFGWTAERRTERRIRDQYFTDIEGMCEELHYDNYASAVELAEVPEQIRGFGHIKLEAIEAAEQGRAVILEKIRAITRQDRAA